LKQQYRPLIQELQIGWTNISALQDVKAAVKDNGLDGVWPSIVTLAIVWGLISIFGTAWHSKWRYALQYGIDTSQVLIEKKPHDCELLTSPLGEKTATTNESSPHYDGPLLFYDRTAHCFVR
jgi:hypothetical protein